MNKKRLLLNVLTVIIVALFVIACDFGTADWPTETPDRPFNLTARALEDNVGVFLRWNSPEGGEDARGYEVYRWDGEVSGRSPDFTFVAPDTQYTDTFELTAGSTYFYNVRAYNGAGLGVADSAILAIIVPPAKVTDLAAKSVNASQIDLTWTAPEGATGWVYIYRATYPDSTNFGDAPIDSVQATNEYSDMGLAADTKYYYQIQVSNDGGKSQKSNIASAKTRLAASDSIWVEILSDLDPTNPDHSTEDNVRVRWLAVSGAAGYKLFYETGISVAPFDYMIAEDANGQTASPFKKIAGAAGKPDTLEYIDERFEWGLSEGITLRYGVRGIENLLPKIDEVGDMADDSATKE